ncbi:MAG: dephospho-CoA kinase [Desulfobulbus sp.]|uniref:dephospho-CoA kinase n=1 Tax=Desulfobulbus sp. TaxID=895 RepID=UPI002851C2DA|nr:dephospho-CoA kinase [Desulfobulbus sp.]MDR2550826.1 dephospho-CoA kinase [Desulfobulbus sp.]
MKPWILGITGGIGSGKSSVGRLLASYCLAPLIDVDQCCRHLLETGQPGWQALRAAFGPAYFLPDGGVDRIALRRRIFEDADIRRQVDGLLHPLAREALRTEIGHQHSELVLVEIPLLFEAGWRGEVDEVLVIYARRGARCCRIMRRDGASRREAARAIAAQMSLEEKAACAELVIDNSRQWTESRVRVVALGDALACRIPGRLRKESS